MLTQVRSMRRRKCRRKYGFEKESYENVFAEVCICVSVCVYVCVCVRVCAYGWVGGCLTFYRKVGNVSKRGRLGKKEVEKN